MHTLAVICGVIVGAVLVFASVTKFIAFDNWKSDANAIGVPVQIAQLVPLLEIVIGVMLIIGWWLQLFAVLALAMFIVMTALLTYRLQQGNPPTCACFGRWSRKTISWRDVVRNCLLCVLAATAILAA